MPVAAPLPKDRVSRLLAVVFVAVLGSFLTTTLVTERISARIESLSALLARNSSPSIRQLAQVRGDVSLVELRLVGLLQDPQQAGDDSKLMEALGELRVHVHGYLDLPPFPGEQRNWNKLADAWARFDEKARRIAALIKAGRRDRARALWVESEASTGELLMAAAAEAITFNADNERRLAAAIQQTHERAALLSGLLTVFCLLLGAAGAYLLIRQTSARRALVEAHAAVVEQRAAELEAFAGRVAHDIRGPLAAASLAAQLAERSAHDEDTKDSAKSVARSLHRADLIVSGLWAFARSGGRGDRDSRTALRKVVPDLVDSLRTEAEAARVELVVDPIPAVLVACNAGAYLSLLGNLVRNAIKYMGSSGERRITVRFAEEGGLVRTLVEDTGPGILAEELPSLFEPYFRGREPQAEGLGLGLATVKKLAEGHGGAVGVRSTPKVGSTFWFDLPRAGPDAIDPGQVQDPAARAQR